MNDTKPLNTYYFTDDGMIGHCILANNTEFVFDKSDYGEIMKRMWYPCKNSITNAIYVADCRGRSLHRYIMNPPKTSEVDHIDLDTLNNRRNNLRICTHQQNQCNQPLQQNNVSGVTGVGYYSRRRKYRARLKASQKDIHLGYYSSYIEAVQARNEGIKLMFGEFARLNTAPNAPPWIKKYVYDACSRFFEKAAVSIHG